MSLPKPEPTLPYSTLPTIRPLFPNTCPATVRACPTRAGRKVYVEPAASGLNRSQIVTGSQKHRDPRSLPYAVTEQGVAMLSSVLRSQRAVEVNIAIMGTFIQLRRLMDSNRELAREIRDLEKKYDGQFRIVFDATRQLMAPAAKPAREMGFHTLPKPKPAKKAPRRKA